MTLPLSNGTRVSEGGLVCLVTGAASGIGQATARYFAQKGYKVVLADRSEELGKSEEKFLQGHGLEAFFVALDIANEQSVKAAVQFAVGKYGQIDVAVNCAGIGGPSIPGHQLPEEHWQKVISINLTGTFLFTKTLVDYWRGQDPRVLPTSVAGNGLCITQRGALVNIGSTNSHVASYNMPSYVASKHGVAGVRRNFAYENAKHGIRINTVSPGCTYTSIMEAPGFNFEDVKTSYLQKQAMRRFAHPEEIASVIFFLCSDEASFITGSDVLVDAGWTAH